MYCSWLYELQLAKNLHSSQVYVLIYTCLLRSGGQHQLWNWKATWSRSPSVKTRVWITLIKPSLQRLYGLFFFFLPSRKTRTHLFNTPFQSFNSTLYVTSSLSSFTLIYVWYAWMQTHLQMCASEGVAHCTEKMPSLSFSDAILHTPLPALVDSYSFLGFLSDRLSSAEALLS